jgi:hypothetical protein
MSEENKFENFKNDVISEYKKGNIICMGIEGPQIHNLESFINQPVDGILYDLNRDEVVSLSFITDPKWVNDYAVAKVIRKLVEQRDASRASTLAEVEAMINETIKNHRTTKPDFILNEKLLLAWITEDERILTAIRAMKEGKG